MKKEAIIKKLVLVKILWENDKQEDCERSFLERRKIGMGYYTRQQNRNRSEAIEQEALIAWCGWQQAKHPELKLLYHVPNGGSRNPLEAANLKRQGVKAGVPDLCLPVSMNGFHGLYIEMKYGKNKTTEAQKEWLKELSAQGYFTAVCYSAEEAEQVISRYLGFSGLS